MKKRLLFVMPSLAAGGGERSLVNLLSQFDYGRFEVDILLLHQDGMFMDHIPSQVTVLPLPAAYQTFARPLPASMMRFFLKGQLRQAYRRLRYALINRTTGSIGEREQLAWKYLAESLNGIQGAYDAAIGFLEKTSIYVCVDRILAKSKIGWIHNDYLKLETDADFDRTYFRELNHIVTVSDECAATLKTVFAEQSRKVNVIHNIVSPAVIRRLAKSKKNVFDKQENQIVILTIGRLHAQKGLELAVEACRIIRDRGYNIQWNVIGEGDERENLNRLIEQYRIRDSFRLLGLRSNPYPYLDQADIYAQTSKFEGKSIAIDEAKILNKPIVVTNFSTARDQIRHEIDGLIVDMDAESVAEGMIKLISDVELQRSFSRELSRLDLGTEGEIDKLYRLLG